MSVVFWDFDGTLAWSLHLWSGSGYKALLETDPDTAVTYEQLDPHFHGGFTWHTPFEDYTSYKGDKWWEYMNRRFYQNYINSGVDEVTAKAAADKMREIIKRVENYNLYEDAVEALTKTAAMGHKNILLSNNYPDMDEVLQKLGIYHLFDGTVVSAVEGYDKPRRELFELAKKRYPADHHYMVGDNAVADIGGAGAVGMTTVLVHRGYNEDADYCFDNLLSVCDIIK